MSHNELKLERPITETLLRLLSFVKPYRRRMIGVVLLMLVTSLASLLAPVLVRNAINRGLEAQDKTALTLFSVTYLVVIIIRAVALRVQMYNMV